MTLLVVGVSHHTAGFAVLEQLSRCDIADLRLRVADSPLVAESMVITTCNRVEVVASVSRFHGAVEDIVAVLAKESGLTVDEVTAHCFVHFDDRALQHLFETACGLDSMVVGEEQILGQVRAAYTAAQEAGSAGRELHAASQAALRVGKDVRADTAIGQAGASVVSVALQAAQDELGQPLTQMNIAVVGSGAMSGLAVAAVADAASVHVVGRNVEQCERLAEQCGGQAHDMADVADVIVNSDLVLACTGAKGTLIDSRHVTERSGRPLVLLDLALPHDVDVSVTEVAGVTRIDLPELARHPRGGPDQSAINAVRSMIDAELAQFSAAEAARAVEPLVLNLRAQASAVVEAEIDRLRARLPEVASRDWEQIEAAMRRTVATLLHTPTVRVKEFATDPNGGDYARALSSLFDLPLDLTDAVTTPVAADNPIR